MHDDVPGAGFAAVVAFHDGAGLLCVRDPATRVDTTELRGQLRDFAELASLYLEQEKLAENAALYRLVAENCGDTLIRGTLDGIRRYVSPSIRKLLGYDVEELVGRSAREIVHPDDLEAFGALMAALRSGDLDNFTTEHRQRHKDGSWVWLEAFVQVTHDPASGDRDGYVVSVRDTSRRKALETVLVHNASHDSLTGLPNRATLYERLQQEIHRADRHDTRFAVLCLDLDGFKHVNDTLGHEAGDVLLTFVAARLEACVRASDMVARRSGDEFVVIHVTDAPLPGSAMSLAQRLIETVSLPIDIDGLAVHVGLSVGVAVAGGHPFEPETLLRIADKALYQAKAAGRHRYRVAEADLV